MCRRRNVEQIYNVNKLFVGTSHAHSGVASDFKLFPGVFLLLLLLWLFLLLFPGKEFGRSGPFLDESEQVVSRRFTIRVVNF